MRKKVRKAIIPAAGFGTRMLPATKSVPKELLPIIDRPIIDYIVAEAFASWIEHVVIVTGRMKGAIEDYFDHAFEIDVSLRNAGKHSLADQMARQTPGTESISFVRQQQARGLGHAVWTARQIIGDEPFAVLLPDMLMVDEEPCLKSMMDLYDHLLSATVNDNQREPLWTSKTGTAAVPALLRRSISPNRDCCQAYETREGC